MKHLLIFVFLLISFLSFSCSPKYKVIRIYQPPEDNEGKLCVKECEKKRDICIQRCEEEKKRCYKKALEVSKEIYKKELEAYKVELKNYNRLYEEYKRDLERWKNRLYEVESNYGYFSRICASDKKFCSERDFYRNLFKNLRKSKPKPPKKPKKPDFAQIIERERVRMCPVSCGCEDKFNLCFQNCGGRIKIKKVCVENCD